jgi:hypothetical protein
VRQPSKAIFALLFAMELGRSVPAAAADPPADSLRVLFIGNSLTYFNDLPAMLAALAKAGGRAPLSWEGVLVPGASLEDQWRSGEARRAIARGKWDFVVLQQGSSASPEGRTMLLGYADRFAREIRAAGARPAIYMVWPSSSRTSDFDDVSQSYRLAARQVDGLLFPVGEAWREAGGRDGKLALYSPDGLHPTPAGSYLAALVMYGRLYEQSGVGLPGKLLLPGGAAAVELSDAHARILQEAAAEANRKFAKP